MRIAFEFVLVASSLAIAFGGGTSGGLEAFSDEVEARGYLRPWLPTYIPHGVGKEPEANPDATDSHIVVVFFSESGQALFVVRNLEPDTVQPPCDPAVADIECLSIRGYEASLQPTRNELDEGPFVNVLVGFMAGDNSMLVSLDWRKRDRAWAEAEAEARSEVLKVVDSIDMTE